MIPLELMNAGEHARVVDVDGDPALVTRLQEMGLGQDAQITMLQPGHPCLIAVGHHRLSFRGEEAAIIFVETE